MTIFFDYVFRGNSDGEAHCDGKYVVFRKTSDSPDLPEDLFKFIQRVQFQNTMILDVFARKKDAQSEALDMLLRSARVGAQGADYNVELGSHELALVEREVIRGATRTRSDFVFSVYGWSLGWLSVAALGFLFLYQNDLKAFGPDITSFAMLLGNLRSNLVAAFLYALIGLSIAVSISATIRLRTITEDLLGRFDPYNFRPFERLAYVTLLALGIMIILYFPVVKLGIGDVLLNNYQQRPSLGILIGLLAGASEPILARFFEQALRPQQAGASGDAVGASSSNLGVLAPTPAIQDSGRGGPSKARKGSRAKKGAGTIRIAGTAAEPEGARAAEPAHHAPKAQAAAE
jgi:hypothetical protein